MNQEAINPSLDKAGLEANKQTKNIKIKKVISKKIIVSVVVFFLVVFVATYFVVDAFAPFTKDGAKNYLKNKKIAITPETAYEYGKRGDYQIATLLNKADDSLGTYIVTGSIINNNNLYEQFLSSSTNITKNLNKDNEEECSTPLTIVAKLKNTQILTNLISKGGVFDIDSCSITQYLKNTDPEVTATHQQLIQKANLRNNQNWLLKNIKGGNTAIVPVIKDLVPDQQMLESSVSISHELHPSHSHEDVEFEIVNAVFSKAGKEQQNKYLKEALQTSKFNIAGAIISSGGDYNQSFNKDNKNYTALDYAKEFKNDLLLSVIIDAGYKYEETIRTADNGSEAKVENFLYFCLEKKMPKTAKSLIKSGYNLSINYKPASLYPDSYPIIFAGALNSNMVAIIPAMLEKENVINKLTEEQKEQFLAILLYTFGKNPTNEGLEVIKLLNKTELNFESKTIYEPDSGRGKRFNQYAFGIWATPLLVNSSTYSKLDDDKKTVLSQYFSLLSGKIKNYDFTKDRQTSIGMASHAGFNDMIKTMIQTGINPNSLDSTDRQEPIIVVAIKKKNFELINILLENKVNLNKTFIQGYNQSTPLILAITEKLDLEIIKAMIEKGADVNFCTTVNDLEQNCPLSAAKYQTNNLANNNTLVSYLEQKGAKCKLTGNKYCIVEKIEKTLP